jgi:hypothetical protein
MSSTRLFIGERDGEEELSNFQLACFDLLVWKLNEGRSGRWEIGGEIAKGLDLG